jgi:hypothetical protein
MLYMICRADQLPMNFDRRRAVTIKPGQFYPRIVEAEHPEEAIDKAFQPEPYKPGGARDLIVIALGGVWQYRAVPIPPPPPPPTYMLELRATDTRLNPV